MSAILQNFLAILAGASLLTATTALLAYLGKGY